MLALVLVTDVAHAERPRGLDLVHLTARQPGVLGGRVQPGREVDELRDRSLVTPSRVGPHPGPQLVAPDAAPTVVQRALDRVRAGFVAVRPVRLALPFVGGHTVRHVPLSHWLSTSIRRSGLNSSSPLSASASNRTVITSGSL